MPFHNLFDWYKQLFVIRNWTEKLDGLHQCYQIGDFWLFLVKNIRTIVAQLSGEFWAICFLSDLPPSVFYDDLWLLWAGMEPAYRYLFRVS